MTQISIHVAETLIRQIDTLAKGMHLSRSSLLRQAIEEKVKRLEKELLDQELREGYIANYGARQT